jgi:hypothetical protein
MFFLLRAAFWLTIVLILLPTGQSQPEGRAPQVGAVDAVSAATAAVADMSQFCDRQPGACVVGAHAAVALGQRAQAGAKMLYEFLSKRMEPAETGSVPAAAGAKLLRENAAYKASQQTLTPADLQPAWRPPLPRKNPQRPT